jgi:hypothetical protein
MKVNNPALSHVHLWSDGCGSQLKNKWQALFCTEHGIEGVLFSHNYFQSCHGKGPSDSEGAVVKCFLRRMEFKNHIYIQTSEQAFVLASGSKSDAWLTAKFPDLYERTALKQLKMQRTVNEEFLQTKNRHTIVAREIHFVKAGVVDHLKRADLGDLSNKITKKFALHHTRGPRSVGFTERSCFNCTGCVNLEKQSCALRQVCLRLLCCLFVFGSADPHLCCASMLGNYQLSLLR